MVLNTKRIGYLFQIQFFKDSEYLRWTIEDISSINPVALDEDFTFPSDDEDPEKESKVQQEIDR